MKTVIFFQVFYMLIHFDSNDCKAYAAKKCESSIETRAVLLSCPEKDTGCEDDDPLTKAIMADEYRLWNLKPSEIPQAREQLEYDFPKRVTDCKRKIVITMKLNNKGKIDCDDGFIVIDHVYDHMTHGKARLLSPVVIKLRQEQMVQLYPLQFQKVVNSNPNEQIFSEKCPNQNSVDLDQTPCGITSYDNVPIPFSEGFCCSSDPYVNAMREVLPDKHEDAMKYKNPSLFSNEKNRITRNGKEKSVIINPNLLNLQASPGKRQIICGEANDHGKSGPSQPPVYFFERDRQLVNAPEALLKELCNLDTSKETSRKFDIDENGNDKVEEELSASDSSGTNAQDVLGTRPERLLNRSNEIKYNSDGNTYGNQTSNSDSSESAVTMKSPTNEIPNKINRRTSFAKLDGNIGINTYFDILDPTGGGSPQFIEGNNVVQERTLKNKKGEINTIEILNGKKREIRSSVETPRHRKKRLTKNNEDYSSSYQYASNAAVTRTKRILNVPDRKTPKSSVDEKCDDDDECSDVVLPTPPSPPNCTLPVFFFTHDRKIICPSKGLYNNDDNVDNPQYEDSSLSSATETQVKEPVQPQKPLSSSPKITRLHTLTGGTWDVDVNLKQGNLLRLDLSKSEKEARPEQAEKIEQINYEQTRLHPGDDGFSDKLQSNPRLRYSNAERYNYGNDIYYKDDGAFKRKKSQYETHSDEQANIMDLLNNQASSKKLQSGILNYAYQGDEGIEPESAELLISDKQKKYDRAMTDHRSQQYKVPHRDGKAPDKFHNPALQNTHERFDRYERTNRNWKGHKMFRDENLSPNPNKAPEWKSKYYQHYKLVPTLDASNIGNIRELSHYAQSQKSDTSNTDNIVDLLAYNSQLPNEEDSSKYLVSSKNIFFADRKSRRHVKSKGNKYHEGHLHDGQLLDEEDIGFEDASRSQEAIYPSSNLLVGRRASKIFEEETPKLSLYQGDLNKAQLKPQHYFQEFPNLPVDGKGSDFGYYALRNRRKVTQASDSEENFPSPDYDILPRGDFQRLRNAQFVRKRNRRSSGDGSVHYSKREHKAFAGPVTDAPQGKGGLYSSGFGVKQCYGDIQRSYSRFKAPDIDQRDEEREKAMQDMKVKIDKERLLQSYVTSRNKYKRETTDEERDKKEGSDREKKKREDYTGTPMLKQDEKRHQTVHCMQYSDLWYNVYIIKKPQLSQLVGVQVYDKQTMCDGTTKWRDLTKGFMIRLGTFLQRAEDEFPTISMTYTPTGRKISKDEPKLDTENYRLLIPSQLLDERKLQYYPEFTGGPSEYLLVNKNEISTTGADCNMVGVSFEAFARQPDRCSQPPGSCLNRQPVDLWREDMKARIRGKRGKYFIENFGTVSNTSIKSYSNLTGDFLAMDYYGEYDSVVEIEMRADGNTIVRIGLNAQIPSVYIENMSRKKTKIVLSVINMGLSSALFRPRLGDCPSNLDPTWCPLEGPLVLIPPQQRHDFKLELTGELPSSKIKCSVEVLNQNNKRIARRRIIIKRGDRCICAFYCKCHCLSGSQKSTCIQLSQEEYNEAGLFDPIPQREIPGGKGSEVFLENLKIVLGTLMYFLLVLGIKKALLGLVWRRLGVAGVQVIVGPRVLYQYYEQDISCYEVVYDECGFPIHPRTCKSVQMVPKWFEMFLNIFFFYLYFIRVIWLIFSSMPCFKICCSDYESCSSRQDQTSNTGLDCDNPPNKYKTKCFAYNATTISSKKFNPQEGLLYNQYKTDEDPLEEDDTEFVLKEIKRYKKNRNK